MKSDVIREQVARLDTNRGGDLEDAWRPLGALGAEVVPYLAEFYPHSKNALGRSVLVRQATRYARSSEAAHSLGVSALDDRSYRVRWRACELLAYSLRREALPSLRDLLEHRDQRTREDAAAAIAAIEAQNHHRFVDRDGSGRTRWIVNPNDETA